MTNLQYDIIKEALLGLLKSPYKMPDTMKEYKEKQAMIYEIYAIIEAEQQKLNT